MSTAAFCTAGDPGENNGPLCMILPLCCLLQKVILMQIGAWSWGEI
ncbi:hypothetical protein B4096_2138 [Heyndrickxia coagulans]|nr:hypothetical protein B4096_2138 [Heyndrickxia coagulans]